MSIDVLLHGWLPREGDNDRMNEQAQSSSPDSGVFSDDESRDTVCLSPNREDLLSSGDESFSLTPEGRESLRRRMSSGETKYTWGELPGTPGVDDSVYGSQLSREPFDKIGLQRCSSLDNTMLHLGLYEQTPVRSFTLPGHSPNKENVTVSGNAKGDRNSFKRRKSRGDDSDDDTCEGSSPREISHTEESALRKENDIGYTPTKRTRYYVDHAFDVLDTEQPRKKMRCSFEQKQSEGDGDTSDTNIWSPEVADGEPPRLVRLKCLLPGEAFKQQRLPMINARRHRPAFSRPISSRASKRHQETSPSSDAVTSQSSTSKVMTSQCSSTSGILTSHHSTFELMTSSPTYVSAEAKPSTFQEGQLFINLVAKVASEGNRTVETKSIGLCTVAKREPVFKIPEVLPLRKRPPIIIRQSQFLRGAKRKNDVDS
ncbi:uncharacterized protein [Macrobrachium rosenbergii]|uniref:uncharacterized protein n=1 Tax=Macrobrachium rosenbergii TaxID=79674 RepID=UPI0034D3ACA4